MLGRRTAPVTLIVYSDFECPFCKKFSATLNEIFRKKRGMISIVYRHFPLSFHLSALPAAKASECVASIGGNSAFWEFERTIFSQEASSYDRIARALVDPKRLDACMKDTAIAMKIQSGIDAVSSTVYGTPTTFVLARKNGTVKRVTGSVPLETLTAAIDAAQRGVEDDTPAPSSVPSIPAPSNPPSSGSSSSSSSVGSTELPPVTAEDHALGSPLARITLVEYVDFECPFCKRHHATIQKIHAMYPNDVRIVFRHFPLSFHQNAMQAAEAAECVSTLRGNDAFWSYVDTLFGATVPVGKTLSDMLPTYASSAGISEAELTSCLGAHTYASRIQAEESAGMSAGVSGTPNSYLLDSKTGSKQLIQGAQPYESFKSVIDGILAK
jgi:protein-disulfide isomerase